MIPAVSLAVSIWAPVMVSTLPSEARVKAVPDGMPVAFSSLAKPVTAMP